MELPSNKAYFKRVFPKSKQRVSNLCGFDVKVVLNRDLSNRDLSDFMDLEE